jgi:hypothetical protein
MRLAIASLSLLLLSGARLWAGILVTTAPATQTAGLAATVDVQLGISGLGLGAAPSLGAFDVNVAYDPAILSFTGVQFGDPLQGDQLDLFGTGAIEDFSLLSPGLLEVFGISFDSTADLDSLQADQFILTTIQFQTIAAGTSPLVPTLNSIGNAAGAPLTATLTSAAVTVVAAPEPGAFWMMALVATLGLGWRAGLTSRRRFSAKL